MAGVLEARNQYRQTQWTQIISECQASGVSNRKFCQERGISEKTYYYWLRRLRFMAAEQATPELIRLEAPELPEADSKATIKMRYQEAQLEIPSGMDGATIAAVLTSIKSLC